MTDNLKKKVYLSDFKKNLNKFLITSRFNNKTSLENKIFRNAHSKINCIYCSPVPVSRDVPVDKLMYVLEMNNDTNQIIGIGLVKNHPQVNKYSVYETGNYNRYNYIGSMRIDRSEMTKDEEIILKALDILCFKGNRHMKRGHGLKLFPLEILFNCLKKIDILDFINNMFKIRLKEKSK